MTSTGSARRAQISRTWLASAPHAMTATAAADGSGRELELVDEGVVEAGPVGEFDISHLRQQRERGRPFPDRQQRHLRSLAGYVAGAHHAQHRELGHQAKLDRA